MSSQPISRHRKQHFPRLERRKLITPLSQNLPLQEYDSDEDPVYISKHPRSSLISTSHKPFRPVKTDSKDTNGSSGRPDKRARDEHNEQERSRRRELAVIYELIRCSFSNDDLRYLGHCNGPKSVDKLSYPQVLQIAYQLLREEQHNLTLFEKSLNDLKLIEKEFVRAGLPVPERPKCPYILDTYRKMVQLVDNLLRHDKLARSVDGVYEVTPAERAAIGDQEMSFLLPRSHHTSTSTSNTTDYSDRIRGRRSFNLINRSNYTDNYLERDDTRSCFSNWSNVSATQSKFKRSSSSASLDYGAEDDTDSNLLPPTPPSINHLCSTTSTCNNDINNNNSSNQWLGNPEFLDILSELKEDPDSRNEFETPTEEIDDDVDVDGLLLNFISDETLN
ncbi:hypothetical protein MS3_00004878 [Schistosoma haematobium]|nr:hypothetical protein MS3_00004878 [Schistosoma haematobium]CAH8429179.1 unnamed protein product [Schistosoma intercalatum]CAH8429874.1 unnamed protein product [Schistosoma mattheei]KAH9593644.1 hypothetical protein MS3_00004878 [Schistosoma haematobium]CAH8429490.1 unnamed protein product [Schistosoma intercalatum]CAH8429619.1 unnamed protein product [Schistosoma haematobium]